MQLRVEKQERERRVKASDPFLDTSWMDASSAAMKRLLASIVVRQDQVELERFIIRSLPRGVTLPGIAHRLRGEREIVQRLRAVVSERDLKDAELVLRRSRRSALDALRAFTGEQMLTEAVHAAVARTMADAGAALRARVAEALIREISA